MALHLVCQQSIRKREIVGFLRAGRETFQAVRYVFDIPLPCGCAKTFNNHANDRHRSPFFCTYIPYRASHLGLAITTNNISRSGYDSLPYLGEDQFTQIIWHHHQWAYFYDHNISIAEGVSNDPSEKLPSLHM